MLYDLLNNKLFHLHYIILYCNSMEHNPKIHSTLKELLIHSFQTFSHLPLYGYLPKPIPIKTSYKHPHSLTQYNWITYSMTYKHIQTLLENIYKQIPSITNEYTYISLYVKNNTYESFLLILVSMLSRSYGIFSLYGTMYNEHENEVDFVFNILSQEKTSILFIDETNLSKLTSTNKSFPQNIKYIIYYDNNNNSNDKSINETIKHIEMSYNIKVIHFSTLIDLNVYDTNKSSTDINNNNNIIYRSYYINNHKNKSYSMITLTSTSYKRIHLTEDAILLTLNDLSSFDSFQFNQTDCYFQINSLSDITELIFILRLIIGGSKFAMCTDLSLFFTEIELLHPTLLHAYPLFWKKIYTSITDIVDSLSHSKKRFINNAIAIKMGEQESPNQNEIWDKVIFDKIKKKFGFKLRYIYSSNDMLNNKIKKFLEISFKVTFIDIYGITECCGYIAINDNKNEYSNSIGKLLHSRNITLRPSTDIGEYDEYPLTLMKQLTNQTRTFGELVCAFCGEEYNTGDYFVKQCCSSNKGEEYFYYVEKIKLFMHFDRDKVIEVKRAEVDEIETFGGVVNNVYLGFNGLMHKGVVVVHLAPNWKEKGKGVDDEKVYQHFIEVVKRTNKGNGGRFWERNVDKKVFYIHKGERFFTPKMKINKGVLYKEIEKYFDCLK